jgi:NAD(P)-dependent dehydrogenase (short-subunit alcohol dehydrogenase family)
MIMPVCVPSLEVRESGDDVLVHDRVHSKIHVLNSTAAAVLRACDGRTHVEALAQSLDAERTEQVRRDIERVLADFASLGLIVA